MMQNHPPHKRRRVSYLLLIGLLLTGVAAAAAQTAAPGVTMQLRTGFDGFYRSDTWTPVQITVANSGAAVEGELRVVVGSPTNPTIFNTPISLPTQSNKRVTLYVQPDFRSTSRVELRDENGRLLLEESFSGLQSLGDNGLLYGIVSPDGGELTYLESVTGPWSRAGAAVLDLDELPETAAAWQALSVLVLNDVDTGQLTPAQLEALRAWIETGGQLVVTGGPGWEQTVTAVADLLPVVISGSESRTDLPSLSATFAEPFRDPGPYLVTNSTLRSGTLLVQEDGLPILAHRSLGSGGVFFLALDPRAAPLLDWDGSEPMWAEVAERVSLRPNWAQPIPGTYAAQEAVTSLPSLALPSSWQLLLFLLVYIVLIGPVNYLVLKRRNQLERAWLTIPVLIVLFSVGAYLTGFRLRGNTALINQISVAYSQAGSADAQVNSLLGLYSPRRASYDLVLADGALARPFSNQFSGFSDGPTLDAITFGSAVTLSGVRVDVSDVATFQAQAVRPAVAVDGQAVLATSGAGLELTVTVQNNGDQLLETASILFGDTAVAVGDLAPGESKTVTENFASSSSLPTGAFGGMPGALLSRNADTILGSSDYYTNEELYARWQLLQALDGDTFMAASSVSLPRGVTLLAWTNTPQIEVQLASGSLDTSADTLHFVDLPLRQEITSGSQMTLPISLLTWEVVSQNNVYTPDIKGLSLNGGMIAFEFAPWQAFQEMTVTELAIALEAPGTSDPTPELSIWDWQTQTWALLPDATWGETAVSDFTPYLGPGNAVRLQLRDRSQFGVYIDAVYPIFTGDLEN